MCSLHVRIAKKCAATFDELRATITTEASDDAVFKIKAAKQRAADECMMMQGCASAERYLRVLRAPTPTKRNLMMLQQHVDELIKIIR